MKLKIKPFIQDKKNIASKEIKNGYESPIGWWKVTTEGDEEGRSTRQLGTFYGHVAEIALHLADKAFYEIDLEPVLPSPPVPKSRPEYQATGNSVWIGLGIESGNWDTKGQERVDWWEKWLDTDDVKVDWQSESGARYYKAVYIKLKNRQ